ncbi:MAG: hypothetical protein PVJ76_03495 [Gemmatimonadota bacterium]
MRETLWVAGLSLLGLCCEAGAQERSAGCLKPLPLSFGEAITLPTRPETEGAGNLGPSTHLRVEGGKLCRRFEVASLSTSRDQSTTYRLPQPGRAFLLSAAVPGAGQWYLGQGRWPAYLAVELWAWLQFLDWRREGHDLQDRYRDLAWLVARRVSTGPRTEAGWDYYEALTKFRSSGAFDSDPLVAGVQPEENPSTFNGSIWALARDIYLPEDPQTPVEEGSEPYQRAFSYYLSRAYPQEFAWDWGSNRLLQEEYASIIREADDALRSSTSMIGVILANHLLSAVDALVSGRLGIAGETEPTLEFHLLPGPYYTHEVALQVRLPTPIGNVP